MGQWQHKDGIFWERTIERKKPKAPLYLHIRQESEDVYFAYAVLGVDRPSRPWIPIGHYVDLKHAMLGADEHGETLAVNWRHKFPEE